jgi:hypothetical protein
MDFTNISDIITHHSANEMWKKLVNYVAENEKVGFVIYLSWRTINIKFAVSMLACNNAGINSWKYCTLFLWPDRSK